MLLCLHYVILQLSCSSDRLATNHSASMEVVTACKSMLISGWYPLLVKKGDTPVVALVALFSQGVVIQTNHPVGSSYILIGIVLGPDSPALFGCHLPGGNLKWSVDASVVTFLMSGKMGYEFRSLVQSDMCWNTMFREYMGKEYLGDSRCIYCVICGDEYGLLC